MMLELSREDTDCNYNSYRCFLFHQSDSWMKNFCLLSLVG